MATTLLLIDYINEIVHADGKFAGQGYAEQVTARGILRRANAAIAASAALGNRLLAVRVGFSADYRECLGTSPLFGMASQYGALGLGTWATEFHEELALPDDTTVLTKHRVGAFQGTALDLLLRNSGTETLCIGGVATDLAVQTTARDAHDRGYTVVILEDLCAATTTAEHEQTLAMLSKVAAVRNSEEVFGSR